jgi:nucleotide-binding universal stress UspA family protein
MYKKMLVLLDGSKLAEVVFSYAQELSARLNINLELLHVCSPQEAEQLPMREAYMEHMAEVLQKKAIEIRSKIGDQTSNLKIKVKGNVVVGYPAEEILKYTDENNIDLIMLSTHGRSGVKAWDIGNVANKVVHASKVPIWIVPTEIREEIIHDTLIKKILLIPLDGSKMSEQAIPHAINIAKQSGVEPDMVLVHVNQSTETPVSHDQVKLMQAKILEKQQYLDNMVKNLEKKGIKARSQMLSGEPAEAILNYIRSNPTQLLVMATHGHAGLSKMIFGSTAENILHLVKKTPILLVKP